KGELTLSRVLGEHQFVQAGGELWTDRYRGLNRIRDDGGNRADTRVVWLQDRISLANRVTFTLGLRYDDHSIFGSAVSPKAAFNLRVMQGLHLRASFGRGFRAPDLGQLYFRFLNPTNFYQVIGNPNLRPERSNSWQGGAEYSTSNQRVRIGLNLFRNDVTNLIEAVNLGFIASPAQLGAVIQREGIDPAFNPQLNRLLFFYKNVAQIFTQGVELDGDYALARNWLFGGAYTYLDARDKTLHQPLLGRHRHHGFVRLAWSHPALGIRANLRGTVYSSWIATRSTMDTIAPKFSLWDGYAAKALGRGAEVFAGLDNFTNSQDPNTGAFTPSGTPAALYRPEVGRTFRLGLRYTFGREAR
ncbi:MAG: TonB-dependent receptor, partial [Acidobacteria bacterium]|nr:TonB-dependent receptor [Acidobacteriota bacterium]